MDVSRRSSTHRSTCCLWSSVCEVDFFFFFFFFNDTATTEIYTFSYTTLFRSGRCAPGRRANGPCRSGSRVSARSRRTPGRSEEHTSELQSLAYLVCRLLLEKKKNKSIQPTTQ